MHGRPKDSELKTLQALKRSGDDALLGSLSKSDTADQECPSPWTKEQAKTSRIQYDLHRSLSRPTVARSGACGDDSGLIGHFCKLIG